MNATAEIVDDGTRGLLAAVDKVDHKVAQAMSSTAANTAQAIQEKGREDIGRAGNFGARWTDGFVAEVEDDHAGDITITATMGVQYWKVFQYGAIIQGKPLLYFKPTKAVGGLAGMEGNMPEVISKHSVSIPKKFHLIEVAEQEAGKIGETLGANLADI
jgi:hypothetical protein